MNTKESKKDAAAEAGKQIVSDPFATLADQSPVKAPTKKKAAVRMKPPARSSSAKRVQSKAADAFQEPAVEFTNEPKPPAVRETSPIKRTVKVKTSPAAKKAASSAIAKTAVKKKAASDALTSVAPAAAQSEASPVFKALAEPVLPVLEHENRARLLMQSPTRLYFYWSVKENPYQLLRQAFGSDTGSYTLVLKLTNLRRDTEVLVPVDRDGEYWFDAEPDGEYQAEVGFYAVNRPYFRIIYSNVVETPRRSPSTRVADDSDWTVSANKFAEVLDVSGFTHDAFDVAMIGDDPAAAEAATEMAFSAFAGNSDEWSKKFSPEDLRHAMYAIATGHELENIRWKVNPRLIASLQERSAEIRPAKAATALSEYFGAEEIDITEESVGPTVFGASLINFPRTLKTVRSASRYSPISSRSHRG
jgi:hypothetical protein